MELRMDIVVEVVILELKFIKNGIKLFIQSKHIHKQLQNLAFDSAKAKF